MNQLSKTDKICVCPEADILYDYFIHRPNEIFKPNTRNIRKLINDKKLKCWCLDSIKLNSILHSNSKNYKIFIDILNLFRNTHFQDAAYIAFKHNHIFRLSVCSDPDFPDLVWWIMLKRNPLDTLASQKVTISPNTNKPMSQNVYGFYRRFRQFENQPIPNKTYIVRFEELISDYNKILNGIFLFLGINQNMTEFVVKPGKLNRFLLPSYQRIHSAVDLLPDKTRINRYYGVLNEYDIQVLNKFFPHYVKGINQYSCKTDIKYKMHWFLDIVKFYVSIGFFKKTIISICNHCF
jgi:hypothetical protein